MYIINLWLQIVILWVHQAHFDILSLLPQDSRISSMAHDCLVSVASIRQGHSSSTIARHTLLPHYLASRLVTASDAIPKETEPALIEDIPLTERSKLVWWETLLICRIEYYLVLSIFSVIYVSWFFDRSVYI